MSYVVFDSITTIIVKTVKTEGAAKAAITRLKKDASYANNFLTYAEQTYFEQNIEKHVRVKNLMTDVEFDEPINRPGYLSPASEAYWSM